MWRLCCRERRVALTEKTRWQLSLQQVFHQKLLLLDVIDAFGAPRLRIAFYQEAHLLINISCFLFHAYSIYGIQHNLLHAYSIFFSLFVTAIFYFVILTLIPTDSEFLLLKACVQSNTFHEFWL